MSRAERIRKAVDIELRRRLGRELKEWPRTRDGADCVAVEFAGDAGFVGVFLQRQFSKEDWLAAKEEAQR